MLLYNNKHNRCKSITQITILLRVISGYVIIILKVLKIMIIIVKVNSILTS